MILLLEIVHNNKKPPRRVENLKVYFFLYVSHLMTTPTAASKRLANEIKVSTLIISQFGGSMLH